MNHLDMEQLEDLIELGSETIKNLVKSLEDNFNDKIEILPSLFVDDIDGFKREVHSLKGQFLNLGFKACGSICVKLETLSADNADIAKEDLAQLRLIFNESKSEISEYLKGQ